MTHFDKDYFERGLQTGKSAYQDYRWIPEVTIPFAQTILSYLQIEYKHRILDFGCAKGYLVKAFREIGAQAYGLDISEYAISNAPADVKPYLLHWDDKAQGLREYLYENQFDWIIAKDVFEHIPRGRLKHILEKSHRYINNMFVIVPLGDQHGYFAEQNNQDPSHVICENEHWWFNLFNNLGFTVVKYANKVTGMKSSYDKIENAHGFFTLKRAKL